MATNLTTIFGSEIKAALQPRVHQRQYAGFPGAHGLTGMYMGSRGAPLAISGRLVANGANYQAARVALQVVIDDIDVGYIEAEADDYTYMGSTYYDVVFDRFELIPGRDGKYFHYTTAGDCVCDFICTGRSLSGYMGG
jgi:hypothetical protein